MSASVAAADDFYIIFQGKAKMTATHPPTFDLTAANGTFTGTVTTGGLTVGSDTAKTKFYSNSTYNGIYNGSALTNNESIYMGSGTLFFYSGGGERMRIDSSGNVGIGTTTNNQSSSTASVTLNAASGMSAYELRNADVFSGYVGHNGTNMYLVNAKNGSLGLYTNNAERLRIDSSGRVMIGTTTEGQVQAENLTIADSGNMGMTLRSTDSGETSIFFSDGTSGATEYAGWLQYAHSNDRMTFGTSATERMRIDSSGNLLVGKTALDYGTVTGGIIRNDGLISAVRDGGNAVNFQRKSSDGEIIQLGKDGTRVGSIGTLAGFLTVGTGDTGIIFQSTVDNIQPLNLNTNGDRDNAIDIGDATNRFKNLYLGGGVVFGATGGNVTGKTLDDYEEGTWSASVSYNGFTQTISSVYGTYTKIGRLVYINYYVILSSAGYASDYSLFSGLPFTSSDNQIGGYYGNGSISANGIGSTNFINGSSVAFYLYRSASTGASTGWQGSFTYTST
jgi:hypothetical protein